MKKLIEGELAFVCAIISFLLLIIVATISTSTYDAGDSVMHYLYAEYSWQKPYFFVHPWAKPLFTLLSSPFAQFGFSGIKIFQALTWSTAVFFAVATAEKMEMRFPFLAGAILLSMRYVVLSTASGLTEPLFAAWTMAGVYFYVKKKNIIATILFGFLLYLRSEGQLVDIAVTVYLILSGKVKYIPFLFCGLIVYGFLGMYFGDEFFWYFTKNPYNHPPGFYGYGNWYDYKGYLKDLIGPVLYHMCEVGMLSCGVAILMKIFFQKQSPYLIEKFFLIYGVAVGYFVAESIFWWKGLFGSFGMSRVLLGMLPLAALICLDGLNFIETVTAYINKIFARVIVAVVTLCIVLFPYSGMEKSFDLSTDFKPHIQEVLIHKGVTWIQNQNYKKGEIYYSAPYAALEFGNSVEAFDELHFDFKIFTDPRTIFPGDIYLWDDRFSVLERNSPLDSLLVRNQFTLLKQFENLTEGNHYKVCVLMKN